MATYPVTFVSLQQPSPWLPWPWPAITWSPYTSFIKLVSNRISTSYQLHRVTSGRFFHLLNPNVENKDTELLLWTKPRQCVLQHSLCTSVLHTSQGAKEKNGWRPGRACSMQFSPAIDHYPVEKHIYFHHDFTERRRVFFHFEGSSISSAPSLRGGLLPPGLQRVKRCL